ncbi:hypothetical protein WN51_07452 [Melipona quadrifasciata]|uniref:Uncharacterized protein n=1 Tax=Melipona quadrifasciata TaxID=166423 RepID=A0A0N0BJ90_9HYME|nr:hypothetical protein WN51_07452 [Melipona quadrifasciata]
MPGDVTRLPRLVNVARGDRLLGNTRQAEDRDVFGSTFEQGRSRMCLSYAAALLRPLSPLGSEICNTEAQFLFVRRNHETEERRASFEVSSFPMDRWGSIANTMDRSWIDLAVFLILLLEWIHDRAEETEISYLERMLVLIFYIPLCTSLSSVPSLTFENVKSPK